MRTPPARTQVRDRQHATLLPSLGVLFAGVAILGIWFLIRPLFGSPELRAGGYYRPIFVVSTYAYSTPLLLLFVPFGLALWAWRRGARTSLKVIVGGAIALHLLLLFAPLPQSQDFYQYLFYGRMAVKGFNPYVVHPSVFWKDPWYSWVRWPNQTSVYGPVWTLITYAVVKVAGNSHMVAYFLLKSVILALDLAVIRLIVMITRDRGEPDAAGWGVIAYAWNPLILITVPLGGLADVALAAGILAAIVARRRGHPMLATVLLSLAALVKIYAIVGLFLHVCLLVREKGWGKSIGHAAVAAGLAVVTFAPYWVGWATFLGLMHIVSLANNSLAGVIQSLLTAVVRWFPFISSQPWDVAEGIVKVVGSAAIIAAAVWAVRKVRTERDLWPAVMALLIVSVLVTPWFLYWYLVAPVALAAALPRDRMTLPVLVGSGTVLASTPLVTGLLRQVMEMCARYLPSIVLFLRGSGRPAQMIELPATPPDPEDEPSDEVAVAVGGGGVPTMRPPPMPAAREAAAAK